MKNYGFKKLALIVLAVVGSVGAKAVDFTVDGLRYSITDADGLVVKVIADDNSKYTGTVVIPETVSYKGKTYTVKSIGNYAFNQCTDLIKVVVGSKVESVGYCAFYQCTSLKDINWSNNIRNYEGSAFSGCTALTHAELSSSLETMGGNVFEDCINITSVTINEGCAVIGSSAFQGCVKLAAVVIPNSVTSLGSSAFSGCSALKLAKVGNGVRIISNYAFSKCTALEDISIGSKVTQINYCAFYNCTALNMFTCYSIEPPSLSKDAFSSYTSTVCVPALAVETYRTAEIWSNFGTHIEALPSYVYLTIKQSNGGAVKARLNVGESYNFTIQPTEGVKLLSVLYNGTDVTKQLVENTYTTPALTEDSDLVVNFDSDSGQGRKGDMNGDNKLDAADVVLLVDEVMKEEKK